MLCVFDTMLVASTIPLPSGPFDRRPCNAFSMVSGDEAHAVSVLWLSVVGAVSSTHCFGIALVALSGLACAFFLGPASRQSASRDLQGRKAPGGIVRQI